MNQLPFEKVQSDRFEVVLAALEGIGYTGDILKREYDYPDWFALGAGGHGKPPTRRIEAALFGRVPVAYETALLGIAKSNGLRGAELANSNRALGAPLIIEIPDEDRKQISVWQIGRNKAETHCIIELPTEGFSSWADEFRDTLAPSEFLRTKNIGTAGPAFFQRSLFAGLIPEYEEHLASILEPRLERAFRAGWEAYKTATGGQKPREEKLFQVAFWLLTGKVFADRGHKKFRHLRKSATPDEVLECVAEHYHREGVRPQLNTHAVNAIFRRIWDDLDFRNLSVEVLSQIWSSTLVTQATRKRLGIYRTRRNLVRYIVDRIPFQDFDPRDRYVLEPCSGSAGFLVGAMERMHDLEPGAAHTYFRTRLAGIERDAFGVEISKLCLSLADYPNPDEWGIEGGDVFQFAGLPAALKKARIVLCNPPFGKFSAEQKRQYGAKLWSPPAELLARVLAHLHPDGVIGFVMPRPYLNGDYYRLVRAQLAERYSEVEIVRLPDKGWKKATPETAIVVATKPRKGSGTTVSVSYGRVRESQFPEFDATHQIPLRDKSEKTIEEAAESLAGLVLRPIWQYLEHCPKFGEIATGHHGLRWKKSIKKHREELFDWKPNFTDSRPGVAPNLDEFYSFQVPRTGFFNFDPKLRKKKAFDLPWHLPKVIINKNTKSRGLWRLAAFADTAGLACGEGFLAIWPNDSARGGDWITRIAAVLNGPVANAFIWERAGKIEVTLRSIIHEIPFPIFSSEQHKRLDVLINEYVQCLESPGRILLDPSFSLADSLLREIDGLVLDAYGLAPRLQRMLLDAFNGETRHVPFRFRKYFREDSRSWFTLSEYLSKRLDKDTTDRLPRSAGRDIPNDYQAAMHWVAAGDREVDE